METVDVPIAFGFHAALMRKLCFGHPKTVQKFVGQRFHELESNIKARLCRYAELTDWFRNENKELRSKLAVLGSPHEATAQVGTVSPMRVCSQSKPKYWIAATGQWDRKDPRCNGAGRQLPARIAEVAEESVHVECSESVVCVCEHYIAEADLTIEKKLEDNITQA